MTNKGREARALWMALCVMTAPVAANFAAAAEWGGLSADGEPFFAIGAYALPEGMDAADARGMGFNLLRGPADPAFLDEAHNEGLKAWISFGSAMDFASGSAADKRASIRRAVDRCADHPAPLFWESMDEPAWTNKNPAQPRATPAGLAMGYEYLKSLDPARPVYMNHAPRNTVETLRAYGTAADIVCVDIYPIIPDGLPVTYAITPDGRHGDLPNQTPSCVGEFVDKMKKVARPGQPVFIVLQGFSWGVTVSGPRRENFLRYPSRRETRFMAYNAIVHGAKGLMYWGLHHVPRDHAFVADLRSVLNEIADLSPAWTRGEPLGTPALRYRERGSTIAAGIETMARRLNGEITLIAANTGIDPAAADFTLPPAFPRNGELRVLGENRSVGVENGTFFDEFEGLGVHVYQCPAGP